MMPGPSRCQRPVPASFPLPRFESIQNNFTYLIAREPSVLDVANTNKCLISIAYADQSGQGCSAPGVKITTVTDNLMKGAAGNAVHCLNLLFGLSERTGLAMKASAF